LDDQLQIGFFLTHSQDNGYLSLVQPSWIEELTNSIDLKMNFIKSIHSSFDETKIFPFSSQVDATLEPDQFRKSHLIKPSFFIRVRPGRYDVVVKKLMEANIDFKEINSNCLLINGHSNLENLLEVNNDYVVQDLNSQQTQTFLPDLNDDTFPMWDACAGGGGKSILLHDTYKKADLYVSDVRETILIDLKLRLKQAKIRAANIFNVDLESNDANSTIIKSIPKKGFKLILADVPCSGSGTWGRNPESLRYFDEQDLVVFHQKQVSIIKTLIPFLQKGGFLLYITCSVFTIENDQVIDLILKDTPLKLVKRGMLAENDSEVQGDKLYAALLTLEA
jgi:16S rRNA (cytosine967-C5)-methyltransferase